MSLPNQLELQTLFSGFLFEAGLSAVSVKNYLSDLRHFFSFCASISNHDDLPSVQEIFQNISKYLTLYLTDQKKSFTPQNTINRRSASIRRFSTFMSSKFGLKPTSSSINQSGNGLITTNFSQISHDNSFPTIEKILIHYRSFLEKEKKSHSTIKNYLSDLNHFFAWSANSTPFMDQDFENILSESQLNAYITYLKLSHTSTSVINRRQSSIKQFTKYCFLQKYLPNNPFEYKYQAHRLAPLSWLDRLSTSKNKGGKSVSRGRLAILYQKYNSLPFTPYLHLAILVLATSAMVIFGYNQVIKQAPPSSAALPTVPKRQLSFQGRLTDSSATPITTAVNLVFKLWNDPSAGSQLYTTGTCSITPDSNGIFNTLIGDGSCGSEIANTVFTENRDVYLEVTVGAETLTPRQQIATVGYALNSETLQGYPASGSATINTVPIVDSAGDINIAATSPSINSTSGTFNLNGQALTLTTTANSGGDIVLQPDAIGGGQVQVLGGTTDTDFLRVENANLTSGALISGYVGNDTATGRVLSLSAGASETDRFYVAASGQTKVNTAATLANAGLIVNQNGTGDLFTASASGSTKFTIANNGNISATGTLTGLTGLTVGSGTVSLPSGEINNAEISELDWTKLQNYPSSCPAGQAIQAVGDTLTCVDIAASSGNLWQRTSGSLAPQNITDSLNLGATATASALVHLAGTADENSFINTGSFGIGLTNPGTALDVTGVGRFSTGLTLTSGALNLTSTSGAISATALGASTISTTSNNLTLSTVTSGTLALTSAGALNLSAGAASTVTLASAVNSLNFDANTLTIDASNNRVGIGLTNPAVPLDVVGAIAGTTTITAGTTLTAGLVATYDPLILSPVAKGSDAYTGTITSADLTADRTWTLPNNTGTIALTSDNLWQLNSGAVTPMNITNSLNLGATATASALVHLAGTTSENSWINTGNVGMGTTTPTSQLTLVRGVAADPNIPILYVNQTSSTGQPYVAKFTGTGGGTVAMTWAGWVIVDTGKGIADSSYTQSYWSPNGGDNVFQSQNGNVIFKDYNGGAYTENIRITRYGNLGIGTTAPTAKLDIAGSASSSGTLAFRGTTDPKIDILNGENLGIRLSPGGDAGLVEMFSLTATGINTTNIGATTPGTGAFTSLSSTGTTNLGQGSGVVTINSSGALNLTAAAASTVTLASAVNSLNFDANTLTIDASNDRVGIGLTNPAVPLDVVGAIAGTTTITAGTTLTAGLVATYDPITISPVAKGSDAYTGTITSADLTADRTWTLPDTTGTIALTSDITANNLWQRTDGSLAPQNITDSLNLGATATASALVHLAGTAAENSWINTGNFGIGDTSPAALLTVGSGDLFQVNSSGIIAKIDNVSHTIDDVGGDLTLTSNSAAVLIADDLGVNGATSADITSTTTTATVFDTTVTTLSMGGAATTFNLGITDSVTRTINLGTGTGVDTINIGTGGTGADVITIGSANAGNVSLISNAVLNLTGSTNSVINFPNFDVEASGNITTAGTLAVNGDSITSDGALGITGATGVTLTSTANNITLNSAGTIELQDATNVTGALGGTTTITAGTTLTAGLVATYDPITISPVAKGSDAYTGTITSADLTADRTWTLPDTTGTIALTSDITANNLWQRTDGSLAPQNITDSLNLGATATASALVHLAGTAAENSWINTGNFGIGDTSPAALLTVGSGDLFQVNSSGIIAKIDNVSHTIDDVGGDLTLTSNSAAVLIADDLGVNGATSADITSTTTTATVFDTTVTTLSMGGAATTFNLGITDSVTRTINLGTGTGVDTINIGTGGTGADVITIGSANAGNVSLISNAVLNLTGSTNSVINFPNFDVEASGNITTAGTLAVNGDSITSDGALGITGATGVTLTSTANNITLNSAGTIELQDATNVTGALGGTTTITAGTTLTAGLVATYDPITISPVAKGSDAYTGTITSADLTADRTWTLPNNTGTIALTSDNLWQLNSGAVTPMNITNSLNLGATATASALVHLAGTADENSFINTGSFGIGLTNPGTALDVTGVGRFSTGLTLTSGALNLTSTSGAISATALGASTISTTSNNLTLSTVTSGTLALTSAGALNLSAGAASTVTLASAVNSLNFDANTLTIDASNNRVGIGLTNPAVPLDVVGAIAGTTTITAGTTLTAGLVATYDPLILSPVAKGSDAYTGTITSADLTADRTWTLPNNTGTIALTSDNLWQLNSGAVTPMNITNSLNLGATATASALVHLAGTADENSFINTGNVGIGLTNPTEARLVVNGSIYPSADAGGDLGTSDYSWDGLTLNDGIYYGSTQHISIKYRRLAGGNWNVSSGGLRIGDEVALPANVAFYVTGNATISGTLNTGGNLTVAGGAGKIDVGTVDPPYTINGEKFATYMASMVGIKEETVGKVSTDESGYIEGLGFRTLIDLDQQPVGSDIWLFSQTTDIQAHIGELSVLLTPEGQAKAWYEVDTTNKILAIYSSTPTNITYRLTAPRFDSYKWTNTRTSPSIGHVLNDTNIYTNTDSIFDILSVPPELIAKSDDTYSLKINGVENKEIASFVSGIIANLKAGAAVIADLVTDNLTVNTKLISPLADIDQLKAIDATISGTLYADNIKGREIDTLHSQINLLDEKYSTASAILADLQAQYSTYDSLFGATSSAIVDGDPLALSPLAETTPLIPSDLALNSLNVHTLIANDLLANGSIFTKTISAFDTDLYIQPTGEKLVYISNDLMILYPDGRVKINGDLLVNGGILAQSLDASTATVSGTIAVGSSTIASESARFSQLTTNGLVIASGNDPLATESGQTNSNATIGTATLVAGTTEMSIVNTKVTPTTLIYITPTSDTGGRVLFVKSKTENVGFTVGITGNSNTPTVSFNYWLVETK